MRECITNYTLVSKSLLSSKDYNGQKLSSSDKIVYMTLFCRCRTKNTCYPSIATIAEDSGISERQVNRCLKRLVNAKLVSVESRYVGTKQTSNLYTVTNILEHKKRATGVTKIQKNNTYTTTKTFKKIYLSNLPKEDRLKFDLATELCQSKKLELSILTTMETIYQAILTADPGQVYRFEGKTLTRKEIPLEQLSYKMLHQIHERACVYSRVRKIEHPYAYFLNAFCKELNLLECKKTKELEKENVNKFCDFEQRRYDLDKLEALLLA